MREARRASGYGDQGDTNVRSLSTAPCHTRARAARHRTGRRIDSWPLSRLLPSYRHNSRNGFRIQSRQGPAPPRWSASNGGALTVLRSSEDGPTSSSPHVLPARACRTASCGSRSGFTGDSVSVVCGSTEDDHVKPFHGVRRPQVSPASRHPRSGRWKKPAAAIRPELSRVPDDG